MCNIQLGRSMELLTEFLHRDVKANTNKHKQTIKPGQGHHVKDEPGRRSRLRQSTDKGRSQFSTQLRSHPPPSRARRCVLAAPHTPFPRRSRWDRPRDARLPATLQTLPPSPAAPLSTAAGESTSPRRPRCRGWPIRPQHVLRECKRGRLGPQIRWRQHSPLPGAAAREVMWHSPG